MESIRNRVLFDLMYQKKKIIAKLLKGYAKTTMFTDKLAAISFSYIFNNI